MSKLATFESLTDLISIEDADKLIWRDGDARGVDLGQAVVQIG